MPSFLNIVLRSDNRFRYWRLHIGTKRIQRVRDSEIKRHAISNRKQKFDDQQHGTERNWKNGQNENSTNV